MAWVSGLKDVLAGCWGLIALWQYLACVQAQAVQRRWIHYGLATAAFILALLAKPSSVVVPALAWVLATSGIGQPWKQAARWLGPWLCTAIVWSIWTKSQQPDTAIVSLTPFWTRPLIAVDTITFYLSKLFWPVGLGTITGAHRRVLSRKDGALPWRYCPSDCWCCGGNAILTGDCGSLRRYLASSFSLSWDSCPFSFKGIPPWLTGIPI